MFAITMLDKFDDYRREKYADKNDLYYRNLSILLIIGLKETASIKHYKFFEDTGPSYIKVV